ncbi:MAG TPA: hypothetical protein VFV65_07820 [Gemmatimonadales bacterium]|nr:hypothetical protein [Gemmatimonadales bacterium]
MTDPGSEVRDAAGGKRLVVSAILVVLGIGAVISTRVIPGTTIPDGMMADWRRYAKEVEQQKRTPSPVTTRMLTETAIAQHEYARASQQALRVVGIGVTLVGLFLVVDLARYRARLDRTPPPGP